MKPYVLSLFLGGLLAVSACAPAASATPLPVVPTTQPTPTTTMTLSSPDFAPNQAIPNEFSCIGSNISPALAWDNAPHGTQSFALILNDPDAGSDGFVHWVIYGIPASSGELPKSVAGDEQLDNGSLQGKNGAGQTGYTGPCPPSGVHHYVFTLYALDTGSLGLSAGATKDQLLAAVQGHILAQSELIGTFSK